MLKKLSGLLLLSALCIWAADFWTTKPFTDWNEKEIAKMISSSPWADKVTIAGGVSGGGPGIAETAGGGGRGGGRGGGGGRSSGPQGDGANTDPGVAGGGGGGGGDFGGGGGGGGVSVGILWQTAMPVRQALIKRQYGAEAGTSPEAKAKLDRVDQVYVLILVGMPGYTLSAAQGDRKAGLLDLTTLTASGKPPLKPIDVQVSGGGRGGANISFLFPKTTLFTVEDKEVEFFTKFDKTAIKHKFKLKDMVFNGKLEM